MNRTNSRAAALLASLLLALAALCPAAAAGEGESPRAVFRSAGQIVTLGHYEQDGNPGNGPEPVEWIILDMEEGRALLLSRYALDVKPFHTESADVTWERSFLRGWLNDNFLPNAFSEEEQAAILLTDVDNSRDQGFAGYGTSGGGATADKVFLLSWSEAERYYKGNLAKLCAPTAHALSKTPWICRGYLVAAKPPC